MKLDASSIRPFISGVIAAIVAAFFSWLASSYNIQVDEKTKEAVEHGIFGVTWVILNKLLSKYFNPGDAASKHLIPIQKEVVAQAKAIEKRENAANEERGNV